MSWNDLTDTQKAAFIVSVVLTVLIMDLISVKSVKYFQTLVKRYFPLVYKMYGLGKYEKSVYHISLYIIYFLLALSATILMII